MQCCKDGAWRMAVVCWRVHWWIGYAKCHKMQASRKLSTHIHHICHYANNSLNCLRSFIIVASCRISYILLMWRRLDSPKLLRIWQMVPAILRLFYGAMRCSASVCIIRTEALAVKKRFVLGAYSTRCCWWIRGRALTEENRKQDSSVAIFHSSILRSILRVKIHTERLRFSLEVQDKMQQVNVYVHRIRDIAVVIHFVMILESVHAFFIFQRTGMNK